MKKHLALFIGLLLASAGMAHAEPAGMVMMVKGEPGPSIPAKLKKLRRFNYIDANSEIVLEPKDELSFTHYRLKTLYSLTGPAKLVITENDVIVKEGAAPSKKEMSEKLVGAVQRSNYVIGGTYMRDIKAVTIAEPRQGDAFMLAPIEIKWSARDSDPVQLSVHESAGKGKKGKTVLSQQVDAASLVIPKNVLKPGQEYVVEVSAAGKAPAAEARKNSDSLDLYIVSAATAAEMAALKPAASQDPDEWLMYLALLEKNHLRQESKNLVRELQEKFPNDARFASGQR